MANQECISVNTALRREGIKRTIDWYYATKDREQVRRILGRMLTER